LHIVVALREGREGGEEDEYEGEDGFHIDNDYVNYLFFGGVGL
jgi:hypothetical protein